jgi:uncharacterized protein YggU (UPF0235/DUF167 family)
MIGREFKFHDGKKGSALAIRVSKKRGEHRVDRVKFDGTVVIVLSDDTEDVNGELINYLSEILSIEQKRFDIIAGHDGSEKLLSILDMEPEEVQNLILKSLS